MGLERLSLRRAWGSGFRKQHLQLFEAKTRPGFVARSVLDRVSNRNKLGIHDPIPPPGDFSLERLHNMDDPKMDEAD